MSGQASEAVVSCREKGDKIVLVFSVQNVKPGSVKVDFAAADEGGVLNIHFSAVSPSKNYVKELAIPHAINDGKIVHEVQNKCLTILLPKVDASLSWGTTWSKGKDQNKLKGKLTAKLQTTSETKAETTVQPEKDVEKEKDKEKETAQENEKEMKQDKEGKDSKAEQQEPGEAAKPPEAVCEAKTEPVKKSSTKADKADKADKETPPPKQSEAQDSAKPVSEAKPAPKEKAKAKAKTQPKTESPPIEMPAKKTKATEPVKAELVQQKTPSSGNEKKEKEQASTKAEEAKATAKAKAKAKVEATPAATATAAPATATPAKEPASKKAKAKAKATQIEKDTPDASRQDSQDSQDSTKSSEATTAGPADRPESPSTDEDEPLGPKGVEAIKCCPGTWTKLKDAFRMEAVLPSVQKFDDQSLALKDGRLSLANAKKQLLLDTKVPSEADSTKYSSVQWIEGKRTLQITFPFKSKGSSAINLDGSWYVEETTLVATISKSKLKWSTGEHADICSDRQTNKVNLLDSKGKPEFSATYLPPDLLHWSDGDVWKLNMPKPKGARVWPDVYTLSFDELD